MATAVVATIGEDRPGLVNDLTEVLLGLGLNVEDSRMTVLGGEFAVLMSVTGEEPVLVELEKRMAIFAAEHSLAHLYRRTVDRPRAEGQVFVVSVEALDHPGIVHRIAGFFSQRGINIRELETQTRPAAHTGTPVFSLQIEIEVPPEAAIPELREAFADYCAALDLDGEMLAP